MSLLLSRPAPMKKVTVVYPAEYAGRVVSVLQDVGAVDVERVRPPEVLAEYERARRLRDQMLGIVSKAGVEALRAELLGAEALALSMEKVERDVEELAVRIRALESRVSELRGRLESLATLSAVLSKLPKTISPRALFYRGKAISSVLALCKREHAERLTSRDYVKAYEVYDVSEELAAVLAVVESGRFSEHLELLKSVGAWHPGALVELFEGCDELECARRRVEAEAEAVRSRLGETERELADLVRSSLATLGKYLLYVDNELRRYEALSQVVRYKFLECVQGWVPSESAPRLVAALEESGVPIYVELSDPAPHESPPTLMRNKPVLRFYQVVTRLYGVPGYREWDPTPLIAYSFALFFGLMNADAGYALLGLLATVFVLDRMVDNPDSPHYREFKGALAASNVVALALGLLSGTVFGDLLGVLGVQAPVVLSALVDPLGFLKLSLIVGLLHVNVAHVLALAKSWGERNRGNLLSEGGLLVAEVFGIPYVLDKFLRFRVPVLGELPEPLLLAGTLAGVGMIVVGSLLSMGALGLLMWLFQITGLLGDALSYVRLAGVGMATYYMASTFNFISRMVYEHFGWSPILGALATAPLVVMAHLFVFMLAQLGAFVHSLRLCMLEFLTKFYEGSGREYSPLRAVRSALIVVKA